jgi:beta-fructofuranosidase
MALRLADKWVWDFWLVRHADQHHVFYLQAPRALEQPSLRHHHASVGHAVSSDLTSWQVLPDAIRPGAPGAWDDLAIWTGSAIDHDGRWYMLYTGISRADGGLIQRIGLAVSDDLIEWEKHDGNPVLEADPRWYELLDLTRWRDQSWRDPWLFRHPDDDFVHALITARSRDGSADAAGVLAHARSQDLVTWEVLAPVAVHPEFAQLEAPQLVRLNGRYEILVSCLAEDHGSRRRARLGVPGQTGTFILSAKDPLGPYSAGIGPLLAPDAPFGPVYAGKLVETAPGDWRFLGFRGAGDVDFLGELTDPMPVRHEHGRIVVESPGPTTAPARITLAPEIRSLIDWGNEFERRHRGLAVPELRARVREEHDKLMWRLGMVVTPVGATADYEVDVAEGQIRVRVFTPAGAGPHPGFLHLHGGGFIFGTIDSIVNDAKCAHICRHAGCVVVTVEYRLAPEHPFPAAPEDCFAALRFTVENADRLQLDPTRLAVGGESAGGNLAAVVALMARDRGGPRLTFQLLEVPVTDMSDGAFEHASVALFGQGYGLDRSEIESFTDEYLTDPADRSRAYASPLLADDLANLPPAHVMTAEYDPLRDSGEAYARRLAQAGVELTLHRMSTHTHGSAVLWPSWEPASAWMSEVVGAIRGRLNEPPITPGD